MNKRTLLFLLVFLFLIGGGAYYYFKVRTQAQISEGIAYGNGRMEADEIQIATKFPGRLLWIKPREGDMVQIGDVVGQMDSAEVRANLRQAQAQRNVAAENVLGAEAILRQEESKLRLAEKEYERALQLFERGHLASDRLDQRETNLITAQGEVLVAKANVSKAKATLIVAESEVERLDIILGDQRLIAPVSGQVLYRLAEPGEVLPNGGRVLTLLDLSRMHMTVFLSVEESGQIAIGDEARIVLDAFEGEPIPARVNFVSPEAQFTPKSVETREERTKLVFRVKIEVTDDKNLPLKPGMPGVGYIRIEEDASWPERMP